MTTSADVHPSDEAIPSALDDGADSASADDAVPGPPDSPGFLLWRTTLRWQRSIAAALRPLELTHVQFVLLEAVWWLSDRSRVPHRLPSQRQVADHAEVDVMMTSQVLRALEARSLVVRTPDPVDTRVKRLNVTAAGRRLAKRAVTVVEAADAEFFARISDRAQLLGVLHLLAEA
jgi:DNA-binding MarR family transcriptional regulator